MKCAVCGEEFSGGKCPKCGYLNIVSLDGTADASEKARAEEYRNGIVKKITNISILGRKGEYNSSGEFELKNDAYYKIADGIQCYEKIVWLNQVFAQHPEPEWKKENLEISYKYNGKEYKTKVGIMPIQTDDFWRIGVKLSKDFSLHFYLGNQNKNNVSDTIKIAIK